MTTNKLVAAFFAVLVGFGSNAQAGEPERNRAADAPGTWSWGAGCSTPTTCEWTGTFTISQASDGTLSGMFSDGSTIFDVHWSIGELRFSRRLGMGDKFGETVQYWGGTITYRDGGLKFSGKFGGAWAYETNNYPLTNQFFAKK